jgi:hypothetical protein
MLSRVACLGQWSYPGHHNNQQKVRSDLFMSVVNGGSRTRFTESMDVISNKDIGYMIKQQEDLPWLSAKEEEFNGLYMDSFSELVDQKFLHKDDGWSFCACFSDVDKEKMQKKFLCQDLISIDDLEASYNNLFSWFISKNSNAPIIFIHFPTVFDTREKYIKQGAAIISSINNLKNKYNIYNIIVPKDKIEQNQKIPFVYHFGKTTVDYISERVKSIINFGW